LARVHATTPARHVSVAVLALGLWAGAAGAQSVEALPAAERLTAVRAYIKQAWTTLSRSNRDLLQAARDPKLSLPAGRPWPVYLSPREDRARVTRELQAALGDAGLAQIELRTLPADARSIGEHGLLYLPHPYVVPGGRFNEMYGWDSYFIQVGLLRDGKVEAARQLVDNFVYQIEHYGTLLNANRTYYLSRSQPPFLTAMILGVFRRTGDRDWLRATLPAAERYYRFWTSEPHLIPELGLSRYYDQGEGPAPEVLSDERDAQGRTHYDRVREYYKTHRVDDYELALYYDARADRLTDLFYKGDRSMRESGFDPSNRFGPFAVDIIHYAPVCLNSLLYRMELELVEIHEALGQADRAPAWRARAEARRAAIERHLWDPEAGLYLDYSFRTSRRRPYAFATTFYPLWVGAASPEQARRVRDNLRLLEAPGGLLTSSRITGNQWDAPFLWAPLQLIAAQGLRRYGFEEDAARLTRKFASLVAKEFEEHGTIVEKYDACRRESDVAQDIRFGYSANQVGFGWTNGAFVELLDTLPAAGVRPALLPPASPGDPAGACAGLVRQ
jgi:alpha,alpha-trehalase